MTPTYYGNSMSAASRELSMTLVHIARSILPLWPEARRRCHISPPTDSGHKVHCRIEQGIPFSGFPCSDAASDHSVLT
jgi:hypothetical protein